MSTGMSRTWTWLAYAFGVLLSRALGSRLTGGEIYCALTGAAMVLLLHWGLNRRWRRWWPRRVTR